jgi:hypothetical protein
VGTDHLSIVYIRSCRPRRRPAVDLAAALGTSPAPSGCHPSAHHLLFFRLVAGAVGLGLLSVSGSVRLRGALAGVPASEEVVARRRLSRVMPADIGVGVSSENDSKK